MQQEHQPYWYQLLNHWINKEDNSGLSIPFLIGAKYTFISKGVPDENEVASLFSEIIDTTIPKQCVGISYCGSIGAYILTLLDCSELGTPFFKGTDGSPKLAILDNVFGSQVTLEWIIDFLSKEYQDPISRRRYSRKNSSLDSWADFDEKEIQQIKTSLNIN